ncbi:hypothetical protein [endosymbiont GvMRE of Glomus versiforme]|uniref:hypothetical protein n=1 Tax=endosymbiont GvMRE of Glomus versiforme TaxID=2039283 RepID=UPI000EF07520|nr:hypothetical protein [endosymbiont GvMRE of Glomus versiforme]RHZ35462.1 hypothetical protein GvMRE_IIg342 [endosymbiont GvMRE of Glomus versiforme]
MTESVRLKIKQIKTIGFEEIKESKWFRKGQEGKFFLKLSIEEYKTTWQDEDEDEPHERGIHQILIDLVYKEGEKKGQVDVLYEPLVASNPIGKEFIIQDLNWDKVLLEESWWIGEKNDVLIIPRDSYHNLIFNQGDEPLLETNSIKKKWDFPKEEEVNNANKEKYNEIVKNYREKMDNDPVLKQYTFYYENLTSNSSYYEINDEHKLNDYFNSEVEEIAKQKPITPATLKDDDDDDLVSRRKEELKKYIKQYGEIIIAKRKVIKKLNQHFYKWRAEGGLTDREHNNEVNECEKLWKEDPNELRFNELINNFEKDEKFVNIKKNFEDESAQEKDVGIRADIKISEIISELSLLIIKEDEIPRYDEDVRETKRKKKNDFKKLKERKEKIFNLKKNIIDKYSQIKEQKERCWHCNKEYYYTLTNIWNKRNFCSVECVNLGKAKLKEAKIESIKNIKKALRENFLTNSNDFKLDPAYQSWEEKIEKCNDTTSLSFFELNLLTDIREKIAVLETNLLKTSLENNEKLRGTKSFNSSIENSINSSIKQIFLKDPQGLKETFLKVIKNKMAESRVTEEDLANKEIKAFKEIKTSKKNISESRLKNIKELLIKSIDNMRINRLMSNLKTETNSSLKYDDKKKKEALRKKLQLLLERDDTILIKEQGVKIRNLLDKVENDLSRENDSSSLFRNLPWGKISLATLIIGGIITIAIVATRKRRELVISLDDSDSQNLKN